MWLNFAFVLLRPMPLTRRCKSEAAGGSGNDLIVSQKVISKSSQSSCHFRKTGHDGTPHLLHPLHSCLHSPPPAPPSLLFSMFSFSYFYILLIPLLILLLLLFSTPSSLIFHLLFLLFFIFFLSSFSIFVTSSFPYPRPPLHLLLPLSLSFCFGFLI